MVELTLEPPSPTRQASLTDRKRRFSAIAGWDSDSDVSGEDYGWAEDDQLAAEGLVDEIRGG